MVREWPGSLDSVPIINKLTRECLGCRQGIQVEELGNYRKCRGSGGIKKNYNSNLQHF